MHESFRKSRILYTGRQERPKRQSSFSKKPLLSIFAVIFFIFAVAGLMYAMRLPTLRIQQVRVEGAKSIADDEIRAAALRELSGNIFYFIPRASYPFVSSSRIAARLKEKFLRIKEVEVHKTLHSVLDIAITERDIWGIGCVKTEIEEVKSQALPARAGSAKKTGPCFYIDRGGFAFEDVSSFEGGLLPIIYEDAGGTLGSSIIEPEDVDFFEEAANALQSSLRLPLLSAEFSSQNSSEARLNLKEGWSLFVPRSKPPAEWLSVLKTLLVGEVKEREAQLDYVDLRFGNKVFYKFK